MRALSLGKQISEWISAKGRTVINIPHEGTMPKLSSLDLAICVGGDGSLIKLASLLNSYPVPVLGINAGSLGFLTNVREEEVYDEIERVFRGEYSVEGRFMLEAKIFRANGEKMDVTVFNEITVCREGLTRFLNVDVYLDGSRLAAYAGDGAIFATPTGSTAYSLSAGGPLIFPTLKCYLVTPLCAHSMKARPIVLPAEKEIEVGIKCENEGEECLVVFDGHEKITMNSKDKLIVRSSPHIFRLISSCRRSYGDIVNDKL